MPVRDPARELLRRVLLPLLCAALPCGCARHAGPVAAQRAPAGLSREAQGKAAAAADAQVVPMTSDRQREIDAMVAEALTAPQMGQRTLAALAASDKAVAGLADTLAAIDSAERTIIDNLRHAATTGYKSVRPVTGEGREVALRLDVSQGTLERTDRALDLAIQGEGFFQVRHSSGGVSYTRNGSFFVNKEGRLILGLGDGYELAPSISIPSGSTDVTVSTDGTISVLRPGQVNKANVGQLILCRFVDPTGLKSVGSMYFETAASGPATEARPGEGGTGQVLQDYLEASNVDLFRERLRLRFLHNWRETILRAVDGEPRSATGTPVAEDRTGTAPTGR